MQFSCESCKATLQIADEKVKGKRLLVRCKRCGAKITISDPALAATSRPAPAAKAPAPSAPAPAPKPAPAARAPEPEGDRDTDTESTRAMDSDLLEKALRASKDESAMSMAGGLAPVGNGVARPPAKAAPAPAPTPRDPAIWFAMIGGKQTGPMTRAELGIKTAQGGLGPRTYLWKEGMASWLRAKDVPELAAFFGPAPEPRQDGPQAPKASEAKKPAPGAGGRDLSTADFGNLDLGLDEPKKDPPKGAGGPDLAAATPARKASEKKTITVPPSVNPFSAPTPDEQKKPVTGQSPVAKTPPRGAQSHEAIKLGDDDEEEATNVEQLPLGERVHQEQVASELFNSGEQANNTSSSAVDLARWASSELGKQKTSQPDLKSVKAKTPSAEAGQPGLPVQPAGDPFAQVPDAPGLAPQRETTGDIVAQTGVKKSRAPLVIIVIIGVLVLLAAAAYAFLGPSGSDSGQQEVSRDVARPSLGGTGEKVDLAKQPAAPAPATDTQKAAAPGAPAPAAARPAKPKEPEKLSADQEAAMKSLDNERGIGTHGPKAAAAPAPDAPAPDNSASEGLTAEDVRKKLDENKGALQGCIDEALRRDPNLRVGKILIATTISPSGAVTSAKIDKRAVDESPLGACLKRATRRIVFPAFSGDAFEVDIPIVVNSNQ